MKLQTQLTLSHLLVTLISVVIVVAGLVVGNWLYLNSDFSARWAADVAEVYADEIELLLADGCQVCVADLVADEFLPVGELPEYDEWLVVVDVAGVIVASNDPAGFPPNQNIRDHLPFGLDTSDFIPDATVYGTQDSRQFAVTAMFTQGWVYYHGGSIDTAFQLRQTAQTALLASLALGFIALLLSGLMGGWLGRYFGQKFATLGTASTAFAGGDWQARVPVSGRGEISQLGQQFNHMADTIANQISDLRQLAETNAQLASEAEGLARLEERNRLARELHDAVKQQLFGLNLTLGSLPPLIEKKPDLAHERIQTLITQTQAIQIELDQIIRQLRPISLGEQGLVAALRQLADQWSAQTGVVSRLLVQEERELPLPIEQALYRIVQEGLQNIGKHAQASHAQIRLHYTRNHIQLQLADNGTGFDPAQVDPAHSFGLQNMRQRTAQLNGKFDLHSTGDGTQIRATLPI